MKKIVIAASVGMIFGANAASMDDISMGGFGSIGVGQSDNAVGYVGYTDEKLEWERDTLFGLQFGYKINENAKFVTQLVTNSRYDYELEVAMAYVNYEFDSLTARVGKLRLPTFFYSDYLDVGYAYPMVRPSSELYENIVMKSYTGAELLIPIEFEDSTLVIQPVIGIGNIDKNNSLAGDLKLDNLFGLTANWSVDDLALRASYFQSESKVQDMDPEGKSGQYIAGIGLLHDKFAQFISLGVQYDNGTVLASVEAADVQVEDMFYDFQSVTGLFGYRFDNLMPYIGINWVETTDNEERTPLPPLALAMNFERLAYSVGSRWDFAQNMSLKFDLSYVDFKDTSGSFANNVDPTTGAFIEDSSIVYAARLDFVF